MFFPRLLILLLLCLRLLGGDGGALQAVAWAGMLVTRAPELGVATAVLSTFDGNHPCSLCAAIQKAEKPVPNEDPRPDSLVLKLKLKDLALSRDFDLPRPLAETSMPQNRFAGRDFVAAARRDIPAVPPPRNHDPRV